MITGTCELATARRRFFQGRMRSHRATAHRAHGRRWRCGPPEEKASRDLGRKQELRRRGAIGWFEFLLAGEKLVVEAAFDRGLVDGDGVAVAHAHG